MSVLLDEARRMDSRKPVRIYGYLLLGVLLYGYILHLRDTPEPATASGVVPIQQGDLRDQGGTPTVRRRFTPREDDPSTTNDEGNDQPVGHFGTKTLTV